MARSGLLCSLLALALMGHAAAEVLYGPGDITTCKAALKLVPELKAGKFDGYTLFCPSDAAFDLYADELGFADQPKTRAAPGRSATSQLLDKAAADPALRAVVSHHVVKGMRPLASFKDGGSTALKSLDSGSPIKVGRSKDDLTVTTLHLDYLEPRNDDPNFEDDVAAADLTFEGPYKKGASKYVVHVLERVLMPKSAAAALRKAYAANAAPAAAPAAARGRR